MSHLTSSISRPVFRVTLLSAFVDNYIWVLDNGCFAVVIDPGEAEPVKDYLRAQRLELHTILITHHHDDHIRGVAALAEQFPQVAVFGPRHRAISHLTQSVQGGQQIEIGALAMKFQVMAVPGHTHSHLAYYLSDERREPNEDLCTPVASGQTSQRVATQVGVGLPSAAVAYPEVSKAWLFCGDTLFATGCGRLFEGSPAQMLSSLRSLVELPGYTLVCCAHEYTLANIEFALMVEPGNYDLQNWRTQAYSLRASDRATLPTTVAHELRTNPFLRCRQPAVVAAAQRYAGRKLVDETEVLATLRQWKDNFRA